MTEIEKLEQENAAMRECISSVLLRLADYDGYKGHAPGLEKLIDSAMETLASGYPEGLVDYKGKEICPLCLMRKDRQGGSEKQEFINRFVTGWLSSWSALHYDECCMRGTHKLLDDPPVEDAYDLAEETWKRIQEM